MSDTLKINIKIRTRGRHEVIPDREKTFQHRRYDVTGCCCRNAWRLQEKQLGATEYNG